VAFVNHNKCAFCLTCVRLCPHGAIGFRSRPEVDPLSCKVCGVCVVECPMDAIEIRCGDLIHSADATSFVYPNVERSVKIKMFVCSRSGSQAVAKIHSTLLSNVEICELPCAGSINPNFILKSFRDGAEGIIISGCFKGNCASIYGSTFAEERVARTTKALKQAGIDTERLEFTYVAGNTPDRIIESILRMKRVIGD